ncbi:transposase, partial [Endozoicomonas atrinae]|uniref:transposase n=1 Tax=Endozoicomonas atrinae TaxID=1333660 RepID=UPI001586412D
VTDAVYDEVRTWQNRPLDRLFPILYLDGLVVKVHQDKRVIPIEFSNYCITAQSREHRLNSRPASLQRLFQASQQQSTIFS